MGLQVFYATLKDHLAVITEAYIELGVRYHNLITYHPAQPQHEIHLLDKLHTLFIVDTAQCSFLDRLQTLRVGLPQFASAAVEPDNWQGGKRRWLENLDEVLESMKEELMAAEFHVQTMCTDDDAMLNVDEETLEACAMERQVWEAKIEELGLKADLDGDDGEPYGEPMDE
jgi:hypothetical protein